MELRAIIIEDVEEVRKGLERMISDSCPEVEIVGEADTVVTSAKLIKEVQPDLIFLDIELPDGTGFDILDLIDAPVRVIFTTASDEYAIRAFKYAAIDYLLKPISKEQLLSAVSRAHKSRPLETQQIGILKDTLSSDSAPKRIALHTMDRIHLVSVSDIIRCEADGNYTMFYIKNRAALLVAKTLKEYDKLLSGDTFMRVHQSHLVNLDEIRAYVKTDGGYIVMNDGNNVAVSTRKRPEVLKRLDRIAHA
jgi:two-component system, LytTR family, response regulator